MFLVEFNRNGRNNVLLDLKGDDGPWEDIERLIHNLVTIDTVYTSAAVRCTNPPSNAMQPKQLVSYRHMRGKNTRWSPSRCYNFYTKEEPRKEQFTKKTNIKDGC